LYDARSIPKLAKEAIARKLALAYLLVAEAAHQVVVHQTGRLHQRINDRRSNEPEATLLQIFAQGRRQGRHRRQLLVLFPFVLNRGASNELPHIFVELSELSLHFQKRLRIRYRRRNFQPVANNSRIGQKFARFLCIKPRHLFRIKPRVHLLVTRPLLQNRVPAQSRLRLSLIHI